MEGFEISVLQPCGSTNPPQRIWVEDAEFAEAMKKLRLRLSHEGKTGELKNLATEKLLFTYDDERNSRAWQKLKSSSNWGEVVLLGQFETSAPQGSSRYGHLSAYAHELILVEVLSN
jgi:hypothetical protein